MHLLLSFLVGFVLGIVNYRLFVKFVLGLSPGASQLQSLSFRAGLSRHLLLVTAGLYAVLVAKLAPYALCFGLLAATGGLRLFALKTLSS